MPLIICVIGCIARVTVPSRKTTSGARGFTLSVAPHTTAAPPQYAAKCENITRLSWLIVTRFTPRIGRLLPALVCKDNELALIVF